ncbi:MAG: hypothetical protein WBM41_13075 [Arenicellales bacterium]
MTTFQTQTKGTILRSLGPTTLLLAAISVYLLLIPGFLQAQQSEGLKLPEDITAKAGAGVTDEETDLGITNEEQEAIADDRKFFIEERRVGGRLERVTVYRKNGLNEVYENPNVDSMWVTEDKELGEVQNVRRWTIGSW